MERLSVFKLCSELSARGIDENTVQLIREEGIDGEALKELVGDFQEFSALIPAPLARLRIKKIVKTMETVYSEDEETNSDEITASVDKSFQHTDNGKENVDLHYPGEKRGRQSSDYTPPAKRQPPGEENREVAPAYDSSSAVKQPLVENKKEAAPNLKFDINNFSLPTHFSRRVQTCIDNGTLAEQDNRAAFIREIVAFFEGILPSPTPAQYHAISKRVADEYPCLKDTRHTNYWYYVNKQITQKYRNSRKNSTTAKCPKLKLSHQSESSKKTLESLPCMEEDEENVQALKKLMSSKNPPAQTVQELLAATRTYRNQWLKKPEISIHDIMDNFPVLKESKWLLFEFNEMLKQTVSEVVATNWRMVCCKLLQVSADGLCFHEEYRALQLITKNIYHKKPAKLPFSFVEATGEIEEHFTSDLMEPRLVVFHQEDEIIQMFLCAENDSLLEIPANTLAEGFTHLMAAYYVFDVSYPRGCMPSLYFLQDILLDQPDNLSRPVRYTAYVRSAGL